MTMIHQHSIVSLASLLLVALPLATSGCSSDTGGSFSASDIVAQTPSGSMEGASWVMADAVVRVDSFDTEELSVTLTSEAMEEECPFGLGGGSSILFSVPRMPGEYPLNFSFSAGGQTITFSPGPGENIIASDGVIVVESVSDTEVSIGLVAEAGDSSINGKFTATLCE
jgi:hypothetical protein